MLYYYLNNVRSFNWLTTTKNFIFSVHFVLNLFLGNIYKFYGEIFFLRNYYQFSCKTLFVTNFVGNTCKFYNFVRNDYSQKNYLPVKIPREKWQKKYFLANFFNQFVKKSHIIWEFLVVTIRPI